MARNGVFSTGNFASDSSLLVDLDQRYHDTNLDLNGTLSDLQRFLETAPFTWERGSHIKRFHLFGESICCILWQNKFYMTGTDVVRCIQWRFRLLGLKTSVRRQFDGGIISDLRNLKPGKDAVLEESNSPFLEFLFHVRCIRTHKKQKVYFWFSVPHDKLFQDAVRREQSREINPAVDTLLSLSFASASPSRRNAVNSPRTPDLPSISIIAEGDEEKEEVADAGDKPDNDDSNNDEEYGEEEAEGEGDDDNRNSNHDRSHYPGPRRVVHQKSRKRERGPDAMPVVGKRQKASGNSSMLGAKPQDRFLRKSSSHHAGEQQQQQQQQQMYYHGSIAFRHTNHASVARKVPHDGKYDSSPQKGRRPPLSAIETRDNWKGEDETFMDSQVPSPSSSSETCVDSVNKGAPEFQPRKYWSLLVATPMKKSLLEPPYQRRPLRPPLPPPPFERVPPMFPIGPNFGAANTGNGNCRVPLERRSYSSIAALPSSTTCSSFLMPRNGSTSVNNALPSAKGDSGVGSEQSTSSVANDSDDHSSKVFPQLVQPMVNSDQPKKLSMVNDAPGLHLLLDSTPFACAVRSIVDNLLLLQRQRQQREQYQEQLLLLRQLQHLLSLEQQRLLQATYYDANGNSDNKRKGPEIR